MFNSSSVLKNFLKLIYSTDSPENCSVCVEKCAANSDLFGFAWITVPVPESDQKGFLRLDFLTPYPISRDPGRPPITTRRQEERLVTPDFWEIFPEFSRPSLRRKRRRKVFHVSAWYPFPSSQRLHTKSRRKGLGRRKFSSVFQSSHPPNTENIKYFVYFIPQLSACISPDLDRRHTNFIVLQIARYGPESSLKISDFCVQ